MTCQAEVSQSDGSAASPVSGFLCLKNSAWRSLSPERNFPVSKRSRHTVNFYDISKRFLSSLFLFLKTKPFKPQIVKAEGSMILRINARCVAVMITSIPKIRHASGNFNTCQLHNSIRIIEYLSVVIRP